MYDVAIVGGGPAGASAATFTARAGLQTVLIGDGFALLLVLLFLMPRVDSPTIPTGADSVLP